MQETIMKSQSNTQKTNYQEWLQSLHVRRIVHEELTDTELGKEQADALDRLLRGGT